MAGRTVTIIGDDTKVQMSYPSLVENAINLLSCIGEIDDRFENPVSPERLNLLRTTAIKLIEEKFGLKIRVCINCRHYVATEVFPEKGQCNGSEKGFWFPPSYCCANGWER